MWKCPGCKGADGNKLRIEGVVTTVVIDKDGESAEVQGDLEWEGKNVAHCDCGYRGTAADCETDEDEEPKKPRTVKLYNDHGTAFYVESDTLQPGDNLTVADDQDDDEEDDDDGT